jgi:hypothetical protein
MTRFTPLLLALLLGLPATGHAEIRVYTVDERYQQEVYDALVQILGAVHPNMPATGKVARLPAGQIVVDTSEARQAEIQAVLQAIEQREPEDMPSVSLRYWVLRATAAGPDGIDRLPPILAGVAAELESMHGELDFTIADSATLVGAPGSTATSQSETLEIVQNIQPAGSRINAAIRIQTEYQELSLTATLSRGEFLVLGEGPHENEDGTRGLHAFIVHWPAGAN